MDKITSERNIMTTQPDQLLPELKSCPFCGGKAHLYQPPGHMAIIECEKCHVEIGQCGNKRIAAEVWNTRSTPTPDHADLKQELAEVLEHATDQLEKAVTGGNIDSRIVDVILKREALEKHAAAVKRGEG